MVGTTSSLIAVIIVTTSTIDTSFVTECRPLDNTIVASYTVEKISATVVEKLLASVVDSLVNLGQIFSWKRLLVSYSGQEKVGVRSYQQP